MERILNWNEYTLFEQKYLDKEESKGNNSESSFSQESSDNSPLSGQIDQN